MRILFATRPLHIGRALAIGLLALGLQGSPGVADASERLALLVSNTPLSLPLFVAQDKGFLAQEGVEAQVVPCTGGFRCLQQMLDGQGDVATVGDLPIAMRGFERSDFVVLATMSSSGSDMKLLADAARGIATPPQLAGKRIGAVLGSASQYFLETYLFTVGVDPRSVTIVSLKPEEVVAAVRAGAVDAVAIWEPYAQGARQAWGARAVVLPAASVYRQTFNLVAPRRLAGPRDEALRRLLRAVERGERFIREQPEAAKAVLAARLKLQPAEVQAIWQGASFKLGLDQSLLSTMESEARWARREGHVPSTAPLPNFLGLVHRGPMQAVNPGAVGIR